MTKTKDQSPKSNAVAALILAAGRSRRMGAFKPLLPFGPSTVVKTCIENMRSGGVDNVLVVIGLGPQAEALQAHLKDANVTFAINHDPESEMSESITAGVRALPAGIQAIVVNPVDHAAVPGAVVALLIHEWRQGARLVKPVWNQRGGHPVLIDLEFREALLNLDPDSSLKDFFRRHQEHVKRLEVNSNYIARDMDTWDDYRALHQEVFGDAAPDLPREPG